MEDRGSLSTAATVDLAVPLLVGFCFAFRLAVPLLCMKLAGADIQTGSMVKLAVGFLAFGLTCFVVFGAGAPPWRRALQPSSVRWVLFFLGFSLCSFAWSETASVAASLVYWFGTAVDVATMLLLLRLKGTVGSAAAVMKGFLFGACGVAIVAWIMPAEYDLRLGDENFFNANSICNVCVFAVFFAQYLMRRRGAKLQFVTLFLVVTIVRSLSKTTIVAFLISEAYLLIQDRSMSRRTKLLLTLGAVLLILAFWGLFEAYYDVYTSSGNQAETLTGRTAIWSYVVGKVTEHPWIGHGFDSMWNVVPVFGTFEARHAENEVLEQVYSYGGAGLILLGGVYGSLLRNIRRMAHPSVRVIFVSIVFFVVIRGFAEAEPFDLLLPLWAVVLISLLVQNQSDEAQSETGNDVFFPATTSQQPASPH